VTTPHQSEQSERTASDPSTKSGTPEPRTIILRRSAGWHPPRVPDPLPPPDAPQVPA